MPLAAMAGEPTALRRHSVTIAGHRTSISLEEAFWAELRRIAAVRAVSLNALVAEIDAARADGDAARNGRASSLSGAIRVFVLQAVRAGR